MDKSQSDSSRNRILTAVRSAQQRTAATSEGYDKELIYRSADDLLLVFQKEVEAVAGKCIVVDSADECCSILSEMSLQRNWQYFFTNDRHLHEVLEKRGIRVSSDENDFEQMQVAITPCESLVARTGSVLMSSVPAQGRRLYAFAPVHIVVATEDQLVGFPEDALLQFQSRYSGQLPSAFGFVTGPSRTADIEKTLVLGAHGPKELIIFVLKNKVN